MSSSFIPYDDLCRRASDLVHSDPYVLIEKWRNEGWDINVKSTNKENLLTCLITEDFSYKAQERQFALQALLDNKIEVNGANQMGNEFVFNYLNVYKGWGVILPQILEKMTHVNHFEKNYGRGILYHARIHNPLSIPLLLKYGANPNEQDKKTGDNFLMEILENYEIWSDEKFGRVRDFSGNPEMPQKKDEIIQSLIEHGANLYFKNKEGSCPWDWIIHPENLYGLSHEIRDWVLSYEEKRKLNLALDVPNSKPSEQINKMRL